MLRTSAGSILALLALLLTPLSALGQDDNPLLGKWYLQSAEADPLPENAQVTIEFGDDGNVYIEEQIDGEPDSDPEVHAYRYDPQLETVNIIGHREEIVLRVTIENETLTMVGSDGGKEMRFVLTRNPQANEQQVAREPAGQVHPVDGPGRSARARQMQSHAQLRGIHQGLVVSAVSSKDIYPDDLGVLLAGDFVTAAYLLSPWDSTEVPEDIDGWDEARKAQWANANSSYCYTMPGQSVEADSEKVIVFELPIYAGTETIGVCYEDNHTGRLAYADADALIEEQTGRDIMQWMEAMGREQIVWEPGGVEAPGDDAAQDAGDELEELDDAAFPDGPGGTWYVQKMDSRWLAPEEEFRLEFRDDGTAAAFKNGVLEDELVQYKIDPARRVIQIFERGDLEVEIQYALYDDIMVLNFAHSPDEEDEMVLCRRPQGNEEQQRQRARVRDAEAQQPEGLHDRAADLAQELGEAAEESRPAVAE